MKKGMDDNTEEQEIMFIQLSNLNQMNSQAMERQTQLFEKIFEDY